jgi:plastocyanin
MKQEQESIWKDMFSRGAIMALALIAIGLMIPGQAQATMYTPGRLVTDTQVILTTAPQAATVGDMVYIGWRVTGEQKTIPHTAVHYGPESIPDPKGPSDYPDATKYQCTQVSCPVPGFFSGYMQFNEPGTYYYRAHAVVDGKAVWSREVEITVSPSTGKGSSSNMMTGNSIANEMMGLGYGTGQDANSNSGSAQDSNAMMPQTSGPATVTITENGFMPPSVNIRQGDSVTWTNAESRYEYISSLRTGEIGSYLNPGESYTHTFMNPGTYFYFSQLHDISGTVVVWPSDTIASNQGNNDGYSGGASPGNNMYFKWTLGGSSSGGNSGGGGGSY